MEVVLTDQVRLVMLIARECLPIAWLTSPAFVVTHEAKVIAEETNAVSPDGTFPLVVEMAQVLENLYSKPFL